MPALPIDPEGLRRRAEAVALTLDSAENKAMDVINTLIDKAGAQVYASEKQAAEIISTLNGAVNTTLEKPDKHAAKVAATLYESADQHLSNAYAKSADIGAIYPTPEKVIYGLETGDIFGSMGWQPPTLDPLPVEPPLPEPPPTPLIDAPFTGTFTPPAPPTTTLPPTAPRDDSEPPPPMPEPPPPMPTGCTEPTETTEIYTTFANGITTILFRPWSGCPVTTDQIDKAAFWGYCSSIGIPVGIPFTYDTFLDEPDLVYPYQDGRLWTFRNGDFWKDQGYSRRTAWTLASLDWGVIYWPQINKYVLVGQKIATGPQLPEPPPLPPPLQPPPMTPGCGDPAWQLPKFQASGGDCLEFEKFISGLLGIQFTPSTLINFLGFAANNVGGISGTILNALITGPASVLTDLVDRFACWVQNLIKGVVGNTDCDIARMMPLAMYHGTLNFIQQWTGILPPQVMTTLQQAMNLTCQSFYPSQAEANLLFNTGLITEATWECYTKVNGNHVNPQRKMRVAQRTRIDAMQLTNLYMREKITPEQWIAGMNDLGVVSDLDRQRYKDVQMAMPHLDDVIRFMVRDVADAKLVNEFQMDKDFPEKWVDPLKKLGEHLGVDDELAKLYWRAHWRLPSPTQLYEMLHRLRPGRVDKEIEVTEEMVETALKQDDLLPFWVPRLMATSYSVMTRVDARRAYEVGALTEEDLYEQMRDRGYNDADAKTLVEFFKQEKKRKDKAKLGFPKPSKYVAQFVAGTISERELRGILEDLDVKDKEKETLIVWAKQDRNLAQRKAVIAAVGKQFQLGLMDEAEAIQRLGDVGTPGDRITELLEMWKNSIKRKTKQVPAATLCKWRSYNVITPAQQTQALMNLGYSTADAVRISRACDYELQEKERKALEQAQEKAKREAEKAQKEAEKRAKAAKKLLEEQSTQQS